MKKTFALLLALIMVLGLLSGCGKTEGDSSDPEGTETVTTYEKKLVIASANPMTDFDPHSIFDDMHCTLHKLTYNQLVNYNFDTREIEPDLAIEWKIEDSQTYWFKLREGVKFSNGEELTADDVVWSLVERVAITGGNAQSAVFQTIEDVEVINDYELRIRLNTADADFLNRMYITNFSIFNREACEADPKYGYRIGTGGWILSEFIASDHATFTRYNDSWVWEENGLNPTEEIEVRYMPEASTRSVALEAGDVVANSTINLNDYETIISNENLNIQLLDGEVLDYMIINMKNGVAADDENLRYAIAYALDLDELNAYVSGGLFSRTYTIWGKTQYGYYDDFDNKLEFNLDLAKEYLAKSKHPDGCDFQLYVTNSFENYATLIQAQLKKIGVNVIVNVTDKAGMSEVVKEGQHDAIVMSISLQSIGDRFHFVCNPKSSTNRALYENPEMLDKFNAALAETDDTARKEIYKEIQIELNDVKAYIPFFYETLCVGANKNVEGILWSVDKKPDYTFIRMVK